MPKKHPFNPVEIGRLVERRAARWLSSIGAENVKLGGHHGPDITARFLGKDSTFEVKKATKNKQSYVVGFLWPTRRTDDYIIYALGPKHIIRSMSDHNKLMSPSGTATVTKFFRKDK